MKPHASVRAKIRVACACGVSPTGSVCLGQFRANCAKLFTARVTSSRFSWNKSCSSVRIERNRRVTMKPNIPAIGPWGFVGRNCSVGFIFATHWRMKKHKRDGASSMESARSAAGSCCSQSGPQKAFIGWAERLWKETLKVIHDSDVTHAWTCTTLYFDLIKTLFSAATEDFVVKRETLFCGCDIPQFSSAVFCWNYRSRSFFLFS